MHIFRGIIYEWRSKSSHKNLAVRMSYFEYSDKELNHLKERCDKLKQSIERIGMIQRATMPKPFEALLFSIIGQQISIKATHTVWERFLSLTGEPTPENLLTVSPEAIQKCGMTLRKANYIVGIAQAVQSGKIDFKALDSLSDEEIIKKLSALNGVGVWTAEMLLLFSLCRPNILSYGDLAIRRGIMHLYGLDSLSKKQFETYRDRFSPHNSVASLYFWALAKEA